MPTGRGIPALTIVAISALLGAVFYVPASPAWADGLARGGLGRTDGGAYRGGYGGASGGTDGAVDGRAYRGGSGRTDGAADGVGYGGGYGRTDGTVDGGATGGGFGSADAGTSGTTDGIAANPYNPVINPRDYVSRVNNRYFRLRPGTVFTYEKQTPSGTERTEIEVTRERRRVMGVLTTVVRHRGWVNGQLKEDARDWYAQDRRGNVWYFGEEVDNYENGRLKDHAGSWEAGVDGAKPGIVMLNEPLVGLTYRQEFYKGQAEDMGTVIALNRTVRISSGTFRGCLQTRDWSIIDKTVNEYKYYCPQIGFLTFEEAAPRGGASAQLVSVSTARGNAFNTRANASAGRRSGFGRRGGF
jgi:hypothetical protein